MTEKSEDEMALKILADVINQKQDELINLQASYAKLGGIFDGDEDLPGKQKLLPAPKPKAKKPKKKKGAAHAAKPARGEQAPFEINGFTILIRPREAQLLDLMTRAPGRMLSRADIKVAWGSMPNCGTMFAALNKQLAAAKVQVVNVRGEGYRMEKI